MVGIGMTLGMVMSVRSGAGPASTESTGTSTRLGIAGGRIGTFALPPGPSMKVAIVWLQGCAEGKGLQATAFLLPMQYLPITQGLCRYKACQI